MNSTPKKEEFEGMTATRVEETILNGDSTTGNFYSYKNINEVPYELEIEKLNNLEIPNLSKNKEVKVSLHLINNKPICDVYSAYDSISGFAACDGWFEQTESYYIPGGMDIKLFKQKRFEASQYIDAKIFEEKFLENSAILYFQYFFYDHSDRDYTLHIYEIYFKNLSNNLIYKYYLYSKYDEIRKLTCYCDLNESGNSSVCWPWDLPVKSLKN